MNKQLKHHLPTRVKTYFALILASLVTVVVIIFFLHIGDYLERIFKNISANYPLVTFIITPVAFVLLVYLIKYHHLFISGSGIPQVIAANYSYNKKIRNKLLSFKVAITKILFIFVAVLAGASVGFAGPSIHIGSAIFYGFATLINLQRKLLIHVFIAIGGAAGLIIVFNTPIAGFLFVIEELGKNLKKQLLPIIAIFCLIIYLLSNIHYDETVELIDLSTYGIDILSFIYLFPVILIAGILGALFVKITLYFINTLLKANKLSLLLYTTIIGMCIACLNYLSSGLVAGTGEVETQSILTLSTLGWDFLLMKYLSTLGSLILTIPGGLFSPSITIGASFGSQMSALYPSIEPQSIIIITTVAYLSSVIRTPLTATVVILELTNNFNLLIPALIAAFMTNYLASLLQKQPIYHILAQKFKP